MPGRDDITSHYGRGGLADDILAAARSTLPPGAPLTAAALAPAGEFHLGGVEATARFVPRLGFGAGMEILDVGCGVGSTARHVAEACAARVTGIDLTPEFVEAADTLSRAVGLADRTSFHCGSALDMPFADGAFDGALTLHVAMNIDDKAALYREVARVLKPGAVFGVYDILAGPGDGAFLFPVPWAAGPATSFLATPGEMRRLLGEAGFRIEHEEDRHAYALDFFERQRARMAEGPPPIGLHTLMGAGFRERMGNVHANLQAGRCGPWEFVCRRT